MPEFVDLDIRDDAAYVTMNRPPANALSDGLIDELLEAASSIETSSCRVAVLRSEQAIFMAGADLGMVEWTRQGVETMNVRFQALMETWAGLSAPTVALINGHALGGGCEMALACDFRIMVRGKAKIGLPEVSRGLLPAAGGTQRMLRLLGAARAREYAMLGHLLDADEAASVGLITKACEGEELAAEGDVLVRELLALPFKAVSAVKRCLLEGQDLPLREGLLVERREVVELADSADSVEGIRSFVEKRQPVWSHG